MTFRGSCKCSKFQVKIVDLLVRKFVFVKNKNTSLTKHKGRLLWFTGVVYNNTRQDYTADILVHQK